MIMLCAIDDVILEGAFHSTPDLREKIEYKIRNVSEHIRRLSHKNLDNEQYRLYARMACVYGVLMWLESKKLIAPSRMDSVREGNIAIVYNTGLSGGNNNPPPSYKDSYDHYMAFILPRPPVGASI